MVESIEERKKVKEELEKKDGGGRDDVMSIYPRFNRRSIHFADGV